MNRHLSEFDHNEEKRSEVQDQTLHQKEELEFTSPEEMLRYDAARTDVPPAIAERLKDSLPEQIAPRRSWWRRLWDRPSP